MPSTDLVAFEKNVLRPLAPRFEEALTGSNVPVERLMQTIVTSIERLPKLLECSQTSILQAAMTAATLGLVVDGVSGQGYIIPFKGRAQFVTGYKGFNTIAARAGMTIQAGVVREGDKFDYALGSDAFARHTPKLGGEGDRKIVAGWAVASHRARPDIVVVMSIDEILQIKARAPGANKSDSPWNDHRGPGFAAMCEKTVRRRLARSMPLDVFDEQERREMRRFHMAAGIDEAVEERDRPAYADEGGLVIDGEATAMPGSAEPVAEPEVSSGYELIWINGASRKGLSAEEWLTGWKKAVEACNSPEQLRQLEVKNRFGIDAVRHAGTPGLLDALALYGNKLNKLALADEEQPGLGV